MFRPRADMRSSIFTLLIPLLPSLGSMAVLAPGMYSNRSPIATLLGLRIDPSSKITPQLIGFRIIYMDRFLYMILELSSVVCL